MDTRKLIFVIIILAVGYFVGAMYPMLAQRAGVV